MPIIDPPATAGGTDFNATGLMSLEAKPKGLMVGLRLLEAKSLDVDNEEQHQRI